MSRRNSDTDRLTKEGEKSWRAAKEIARDSYPDADLELVRYAREDDSRHASDGAWLSAVVLTFCDELDEEDLEGKADRLRERAEEDDRILNAEVRFDTNPRNDVTLEVADFRDPR